MDTTFTPGITHVVAYTATHAESPAVSGTKVRVVCTTAAMILFGAAPVATTVKGMPMIANVPEYFDITPGHQISAVELAADGTMYVTEMSKP